MQRIGLTGGIASGKTALADALVRRGLTVIDADDISRALMQPGEPGYRAAVDHFGEGILDAEGKIDRPALRRRVFERPEERRNLERMLHPLIRQRIEQTLDELEDDIALIVVPLLFESGFDDLVDRSLAIDCPRDIQIERLMQRDGIDRMLAERMLDAQMSNAERVQRSDHSVVNDGSQPVEAVAEQVLDWLYGRGPWASRL